MYISRLARSYAIRVRATCACNADDIAYTHREFHPTGICARAHPARGITRYARRNLASFGDISRVDVDGMRFRAAPGKIRASGKYRHRRVGEAVVGVLRSIGSCLFIHVNASREKSGRMDKRGRERTRDAMRHALWKVIAWPVFLYTVELLT